MFCTRPMWRNRPRPPRARRMWFIAVVSRLTCRVLFLENVKHILKVGNGKVIEYILDKLDKTGYNVQYFKMSPHEYGIPQQRERIYFVCIRD